MGNFTIGNDSEREKQISDGNLWYLEGNGVNRGEGGDMHSRCPPPKKLFLFREGESIQGDGKKHLMLFSFFFSYEIYILFNYSVLRIRCRQ